jgi:tetratricopeptide (TPR) repeat protein
MSSKFSYEEYVHLGKQSYREKRYDAALGHFQNALRLAKSSSLEILDSLAAVSEKLGDLDASLRYGKQMLQCDATSSKVRSMYNCLFDRTLI